MLRIAAFLWLAGASLDEIDAMGFDGETITPLLFDGDEGDALTRTDFLIEYNGESWDGCAAYLANDFPDIAFDMLYDGVD